ncbi:MAG: SUMF1/EgtB/PvdO family nonheme iron enzyme, partial [Acidobacteria bacterium]|nr:SUMF1/EgtB/PvdO family nonheme iron enzyme [Acidobacteriota bacterium]
MRLRLAVIVTLAGLSAAQQDSAPACRQCPNWTAPGALGCFTKRFCQPKDACDECSKAWCETKLGRKLDCGEAQGEPVPPGQSRPGDAKANPRDGQPYVWIPPGSFQMGCSPGDAECGPDERPARPVTISRGFWLGQTAVTAGAWKRYRAATGTEALPTFDRNGRTNLNEAASDDRMPAVMMTWEEARSFCV